MPGFDQQTSAPKLTIGGRPWVGCPGSLAGKIKVSQIRRLAWHTEGRLGVHVSQANPKVLDCLESYVSGQIAARVSQHKAEAERFKNGK